MKSNILMNKRLGAAALAAAVLLGTAACTKSSDQAHTNTPVTFETDVIDPLPAEENKSLDAIGDWPEEVTKIVLSGSSAQIDGSGAHLKDGVLKITAPGTYALTGSFYGEVEIAPDTGDESTGEAEVRGQVTLLLAGVTVNATDTPALTVRKTEKTTLLTVTGTENRFASASFTERTEENGSVTDAVIYSKNDLVLCGDGLLTVDGPTTGGIKSTDVLSVTGGEITVTAATFGLSGKDALLLDGGTVTVEAGKDGVQATSTEDGTLGYLAVRGGTLTVTAGDEGLEAASDLIVRGGTVSVTATGNGIKAGHHFSWESGTLLSLTAGKNGLKAETGLLFISGGSLSLTAEGDGFDTADYLQSGGTVTLISNGGDGIQAAGNLSVTGGTLTVTTYGKTYKTGTGQSSQGRGGFGGYGGYGSSAYDTNSDGYYKVKEKGIKVAGNASVTGGSVTLSTTGHALTADGSVYIGGDAALQIDAYADRCNSKGISAAADLTVAGGTVTITRSYEGLEGKAIYLEGGTVTLTSTDDGLNASDGSSSGGFGFGMSGSSDCLIRISGGTLNVNASGDGLDSNGNIVMTGGTVLVSGPTDSGNGAIDYGDGNCTFTFTGGTLLAVGSTGMAEAPATTGTGAKPYIFLYQTMAAGDELTVTDEGGNVLLSWTNPKSAGCAVIGCDGFKIGGTYTVSAGGKSYTVTLSSVKTTAGTSSGGQTGPGGQGGWGGGGGGGGRGPGGW